MAFEFATKEEVQNRLLGLQNLLATIKPMGQKVGCPKYQIPMVQFGGCPSTNGLTITLPLAMMAAKSYDRAQIIHFLTHELGHVFFTPEAPKDFRELKAQFKKLGDKLAFEFFNVVEDIRVDFLGDKIIKSSKTFGEYTLLSTLTHEYQAMHLTKAPLERVFGLAMILEGYMEIYSSDVFKKKAEPFLNALKAKLQSYISKRRLKWYEPDYKEAAEKVKNIVRKLSSCSENWYWDMETTQYAFDSMCDLFKKYFKEAAEEEKEQQGNNSDESNDKSDDSQESEDKSDNSEESEDESEGSSESDDDSEDSEESEDKSEGSESDDDSEDSEESEDKSEGSELEDESEGSESEDKSDDSQESEDKSDDSEETEAKRKGETAIMRGFRESQQIMKMKEDRNEVVDLLQNTQLESCGDLFDRHSSGANVFTFDNSKGAKDVKSQLEKASEAAKEVCSADYQQNAVGEVKSQAYWDFVNNRIVGKCTNLVSKLREALKAYTPKQYTKPVKAGFKLNSQQIHKIGQGQYVPKPFMKKDKGVDLSTEIVFLADISGSMGLDLHNNHARDSISSRYDMMAASLKILFNSLQRVGNNNLLINLATFGSKVKVIKRAKDPFSVLEKKMPDVSGSTEGRGATLWAIDVLRKSKAHRKIIICLTDGGWDSTCNINPKAIHALGIETYGIIFNNIYEAEKMIQHKYIPTFDRLFQVGGNLEEFYLKFLTELLSNTPNHA